MVTPAKEEESSYKTITKFVWKDINGLNIVLQQEN
jgi:hypothetical protein